MKELDELLGNEIELSYYDHNEVFGSLLPRAGRIVSRHETENVQNWFLVTLVAPLSYSNVTYSQLLIRSKWQDQEICSSVKTAVFILLVRDAASLVKQEIDIEEFEHVAWGFAVVSPT